MAIHDFYRLQIHAESMPQQEIALPDHDVVLGRDPGVDIVIDSAGISRQHARISYQDGGYVIEDLGSSNGTFLNDQRIDGRTPLNPDDRIGLGYSVTATFMEPVSSGTVTRVAHAPPEAVSATVMADEGFGLGEMDNPPRLAVTVAGDDPQIYDLTRDIVTIGRADDNDIVIPSKIVSRYHAQLKRTQGGYQLVPLPEAGNPVLFEGRPLPGPHLLRHDDTLRIGSLDPGLMVSMTYQLPAGQIAQEEALRFDFGEDTRLTVGRDPANDIVLDVPQVSRFHAQIERIGQRYRARDLQSSNGTFVNNERLEGEAWLKPDDSIRIGPYRFVIGEDQLAQFDDTGGLLVEVVGLNKWVRDDLNILQDISLVFQPREFIVVVGQSGGGKSTLIDAIAGYRPATHGQVLVNDINV